MKYILNIFIKNELLSAEIQDTNYYINIKNTN